ncbi:MAG: acetate kinase [Victivallales bacterium]|nr:acetate kinase [Victivallales bacterium]
MKILVINSGSSSLKFNMFDMTDKSVLCKGIVERIGMPGTKLTYQAKGEKCEEPLEITKHSEALKSICAKLTDAKVGVISSLDEISAIGHRVLHGGTKYTQPILVDENVKAKVREYFVLGPLHNPPNLGGIEACEEAFPGIPNVAVFDTAFHMSMGPEAYMYALPREFYDKYGVRKYGFHGTSHKYVYGRTCEFLGLDPAKARIISCHLGNGSSLCAVNGGKVVDTTMGLTPLAGLVMGTRCGDIDPAVVAFLQKQANLTPEEMDSIMNKKSGLLGVSGLSSDMRDIQAACAAGNEHAQQAYDMFLHRLIHYIGGYYLLLGGVDAILFTGGIGENSCEARKDIITRLEALGCKLNEELNATIRGKEAIVSTADSKFPAVVMPTNEELMIALETANIVSK